MRKIWVLTLHTGKDLDIEANDKQHALQIAYESFNVTQEDVNKIGLYYK